MLRTTCAYVLIAFFFLTEGRTRKGPQAKSLETGQFDRRSTEFIGLAFLIASLCLLSAPVLNYFEIGHFLPTYVGWIGVAMAIGGIAFRWWAGRTLGEFYTRTLRIVEKQPSLSRAHTG